MESTQSQKNLQSRQMKEGYKQTEVGVIPKDWNIKVFSEVSYMKGRIGWQGLNQTEFTMNSNEPFLITGMNFKDGEIRWNEVYHISEGRYEIAKEIQLRHNDVLMTKDGTIGKLLYVDNIPFPHKASLNSHLLVFRPLNNSYNPKYLYYNLLSPYFLKHIELSKSGTTFYGISQTSVGEYKIILPTIAEQTAIAAALSDADALINSVEKLIAKKRNIKQGAMQKLLQPKEGWEVKRVEEIADVKSGKRLPLGNSLSEKETLHPYLRILDMINGSISLDDLKYVPDEVYPSIKNYRIFRDDIYISVAGTLGLIGRVPKVLDGANLTENANRLTNIKCNIDYLCYVLKSSIIQNRIEAERTLGAQPKLALIRIRNFEIPFPPIEEQTQIASILSNMDAEITALENKLRKYKNIKLGMMQNLLTGKIRLV